MTFEEWYSEWQHPGMTEDELEVMARCRAAWEFGEWAVKERCARVAERATLLLRGFGEPDAYKFAVGNMLRLREAIAKAIREGE